MVKSLPLFFNMHKATLYVNNFPRGALPKALVSYFNLDFEVRDATASPEFAKEFPLKKIPAVVFPDGSHLTEIIAIVQYLVESTENENIKKDLLGTNALERAQVVRWMSLANSDFMMPLTEAFLETIDQLPYHGDLVKIQLESVDKAAKVFEDRLNAHEFLVADRLTLADLMVASLYVFGFSTLLGKTWRSQHPGIMKWFDKVSKSPICRDILKKDRFVEDPAKHR